MRRLFGRRLFVALMRKTIFGQFMCSEEAAAVLELARRHSKSGICPMFAYTAVEFHGKHGDSSSSSQRRARDIWCQQNLDAIKRSIEMAAKCKEFTADKPTVTTKITFLTDYSVLRKLTDVINQQTTLIQTSMIASDLKERSKSQGSMTDFLSQVTSRNRLDDGHLSRLAPPVQIDLTLGLSGHQLSSLLTSVAFHLTLNRLLHTTSATENVLLAGSTANVSKLTEEDVEAILKLWQKMEDLNERSSEHDVALNYDAEQTFIQPAIEALVLDSKRVYNKQYPVVLNTYQCYLKRTLGIVKRDLELSREEGFCFGGKVVRGAYMDEERRLAREGKYPDPVNDTYEVTTAAYSQAIEEILHQLSVDRAKPMRIIVATHNLDTVSFVLDRLEEKKFDAREIGLSFAQLLGTRDYISFSLGAAGYPAGKLIHYAEPENGLAYLSRRLLENRSGLPSPAIERRLLLQELRRRIRGAN